MIRLRHLSLIALALGLAACAESSTAPTVTSTDDDYALVMFGEIGSALEGTLGTQSGTQPMDGRSWMARLPDSLALTATQRTAIAALRATFRQNNAATLDSLRQIFVQARDARRAGATREEVRAILVTGRPIAEALRPKVLALHLASWSVLSDAQRAWLIANRPSQPPVVGGLVSCQACGCPGSGC
ncbi:MAG: hypothetical protein P3A32_00585 [Gemmatimonadota bacterium]|jgi:hypothetical protein|nr:hypothetical protein [Gemmatimonadota bacterium]MDQ8146373.1 hypothetical protein [Gemmatimonadota bacterium]MDQ8148309.1 hypothetical protein [Gemmatimonadota bacterium]MDQ8155881.1 hypothetical protein [Gemmatimonadota bacterium]MDQ8170717.1 hypothetical protein [Gemmatimonadota bacterium]